MAYIESKKVTLLMTKSTATPHVAKVTDVNVDTPLSITTTASTVADYDLGYIKAIPGYNFLDGSWFAVESGATSTAFDTIGIAGYGLPAYPAGTKFDIALYKPADFFELCLSSIDISRGTASTIATPTFCNRGQSISSVAVDKGTVSFGGYVDVNSETYKELAAALASDEEKTIVVLTDTTVATSYSNGAQGVIVVGVKLTSIDFDLPLDGAIAFNAEAKITRRVQYVNYQ